MCIVLYKLYHMVNIYRVHFTKNYQQNHTFNMYIVYYIVKCVTLKSIVFVENIGSIQIIDC